MKLVILHNNLKMNENRTNWGGSWGDGLTGCLLSKHVDLCLDPQHQCTKLGKVVVCCVCLLGRYADS